jgi:hypothetical protein
LYKLIQANIACQPTRPNSYVKILTSIFILLISTFRIAKNISLPISQLLNSLSKPGQAIQGDNLFAHTCCHHFWNQKNI